ncbi:MerR family transcriptional regulator [Auraticoccus monumenti]|uniref:DNA-binding transcriptional regulator, MerR family n=1 Tax=Auraticoccus monumenti TaxID=675864 RepID=A0A1G6YF15_9ACTN|nr:MerR family transcriptional regulator [Auraticoccus monumenti]SDD88593.1 DNA-binding transcriptional regulator, MerR family [Auraticoccus monumenti]
MRIGELSRTSRVPVATIKYYLREGLLHPGVLTSATQARYDDSHLQRLALVRALADGAGLPLARIRTVLAAVDHPPATTLDLLATVTEEPGGEEVDRSEALALLGRLGWDDVDPGSSSVLALARALRSMHEAGFTLGEDHLLALGRAMGTVAEVEVAGIPLEDPAAAARYVLLGTALVAPVLLALRQVGHVHTSRKRLGG